MGTEPAPYVVRQNQRDTADTVTLALAPTHGPPLTFLPGQFDMLYAFGVGDVAISVSGRSADGLLHTVRAVGAVTEAICAAPEGTVLGVRGPYGRGWDLASLAGLDVLVVAGGLGLAPLREAIRRLLERRADYGRFVVVVGARTAEALLYVDEIHAWANRGDVEVFVTVDRAGPDWRGNVGLVTDVLPDAHLDGGRTGALLCGPEVMMGHTAAALVENGFHPGRIQLSLERNMRCAVAQCGHCQMGPVLLCRDGPVLTWDVTGPLLAVREL